MKVRAFFPLIIAALVFSGPLQVYGLEALHAKCSVGLSEKGGELRLHIMREDCNDDEHCNQFSDNSPHGLTGVSVADLGREGAQLTAHIDGEAGKFTCAGVVREGELRGQSTFTPNEEFVSRIGQMGFTGLTSEKLQVYCLFDINTTWVQSLKSANIAGLTTDNLVAMRIFRVEPAYVNSLTSMGYKAPGADKLIALSVHKVNMDEVKEIRGLGFDPTLDELIQIRIFKITPEFIRQMQSHGFEKLTISKLVQMKIFKLDE
jgi:hypothetical protein